MTKVLFVCLGNICRSPMAEGLMRQYAEENGVVLTVDSAATSRWEVGKPPHPGTQKIFRREGIDFSNMRARQIIPQDFYQFDYIIGMDADNVADLLAIAPAGTESKVNMYLSVVPGQEETAIPDPWYTGDFDETFQLISLGLQPWLTIFKAQQG